MLIPLLVLGLLGYSTYQVSKNIAGSARASRRFRKGKKDLVKLIVLQHLRKTRNPELGLTIKERSFAARTALDGDLPMTAMAFENDGELPLSEVWPGTKISVREHAENVANKMPPSGIAKILKERLKMAASVVGTAQTTATPTFNLSQEIALAESLLEERLKKNPNAIFQFADKKRFRKRDYADLMETLRVRTKGSPIAPSALHLALSKRGVVSVMGGRSNIGAFRLGRLGRIGRIGRPDANWALRSEIISQSIPSLEPIPVSLPDSTE